jgi:hypothetical protein
MKNLSLIALLATGILAGGIAPATAADLGVGGDCCSDLEERIAELEATTVRKGNRKVSLTISGWVAQQVTYWNDGVESNAYVSDIGTTLASHVRLSGTALISPGLTAGYVLQIEAIGNEPLGLSQSNDNAKGGVGVLQSFWFLKSDSLGKLSVGLQSSAADNAAILVDGSGSLVPANYVLFDNNNFTLRAKKVFGTATPDKPLGGPLNSGAGATWGSLATCSTFAATGRNLGLGADCDGVPNNVIRYDTPTVAGFSASASWGEDDIWAVAGRYAGEFNGIKVAAAIAYTESTDDNAAGGADIKGTTGGLKAGALQMGAYVQHIPTGLFVYGAYGKDFNSKLEDPAVVAFIGRKKEGDNFYLKAGVRGRWNSLGHTVVFGEYGENNNKQSLDWYNMGFTDSNVTQYGGGIVQEIDAAAMSVWFVYRRFEGDISVTPIAGLDDSKIHFEPLDIIKVGALINF